MNRIKIESCKLAIIQEETKISDAKISIFIAENLVELKCKTFNFRMKISFFDEQS